MLTHQAISSDKKVLFIPASPLERGRRKSRSGLRRRRGEGEEGEGEGEGEEEEEGEGARLAARFYTFTLSSNVHQMYIISST